LNPTTVIHSESVVISNMKGFELEKEDSIKRQQLVSFASGGAMVLIFLFLFYVFRRKQNRERLYSPPVTSTKTTRGGGKAAALANFNDQSHTNHLYSEADMEMAQNNNISKNIFYLNNGHAEELATGMILYGKRRGDLRAIEMYRKPAHFTSARDVVSVNSSATISTGDFGTIEFEPDDHWDPDDAIDEFSNSQVFAEASLRTKGTQKVPPPVHMPMPEYTTYNQIVAKRDGTNYRKEMQPKEDISTELEDDDSMRLLKLAACGIC